MTMEFNQNKTAANYNWTAESAELKLNQFLRDKKLTPDYKFSVQREIKNNTWSFVCECELFVEELNRNVSSKALGCSKESAKKKCIFLIVRQLVDSQVLNVDSLKNEKEEKNCEIETPAVKAVERCLEEVTNENEKGTARKLAYKVGVDPALIQEARSILQEVGIQPIKVENDLPTSRAISLLDNVEWTSGEADIVNWIPPAPDENVWKSGGIAEKPVEKAFLDDISQSLEKDLKDRMKHDTKLQESLRARDELPISKKKTEIMNAIRNNPIIIIYGQLATKKTTQICQYILDDYILAGQGAHCNILATQTHHLSAISVADRISVERGEELGTSVGYSVRFDNVFPRLYGSILFCTVDILLRKMEYGLEGISHIIVDGLQDRDLNTDFLLVVLRDMVHKYPDLRIIFMSDTNHMSVFGKYFRSCPSIVLKVERLKCRTYFFNRIINNVVKGIPASKLKKLKPSRKYTRLSFQAFIEVILKHIENLNMPGTILIFEGSFDGVQFHAKHLKKHPIFGQSNYLILCLHSDSSKDDLRKVTNKAPPGVTKVILTTSIAETSILIDDVVFVIDTCKTETKVFTYKSLMNKYLLSLVSRSNRQYREDHARCNETGFYFCLLSEEEITKLPDEYAIPEVSRSSLCEIALFTKLLRFNSIEQLLNKMIDPPSKNAIILAKLMLRDLNCLSSSNELTPLGQMLARLPIESRLGKMAILSMLFGIGDMMTTILANHLIRMPISPEDGNLVPKMPAGKYRFSNHIGIVGTFQEWYEAVNRGPNEEEEFCTLKNVSACIAKKVNETKEKLKELLVDTGFLKKNLLERTYDLQNEDSNVNMATALLTVGLYPNICIFGKKKLNIILEYGKARTLPKLFGIPNYDTRNELEFYSPFFVFGEMAKNKLEESCRQLTVVTPIHLLLFGCRKIELVDKVIRMDNWIDLEMDLNTASVIVALRFALDRLVMKAAKCPKSIIHLSSLDQKVIEVTKKLCTIDAGRYGLKITDNIEYILQTTMEICDGKQNLKRPSSSVNSASPAKIMKKMKTFPESDKFVRVFRDNNYLYVCTDKGVWGRREHTANSNDFEQIENSTAKIVMKKLGLSRKFRTPPALPIWKN